MIADAAAVSLLYDLCAVYSPSCEERGAVDLMVQKAAAAGMRAFVDEAGNFVAERGRGSRTLLFLGHIDTVPGFFPVRLEDGKLYGRGAVDAKGALAAFFVAASQVRDLAHLKIVIVGAVEEEAPSSKGAHHVAPIYRPDFAIIGEPSGAAGITLGYKGRLNLRYTHRKPHAHAAAAGRSVAADAVAFWSRVDAWCGAFNDGKKAFETVDPHLADVNTTSDGLHDSVQVRGSFRLPLGFPIRDLEDALSAAAGAATLQLEENARAFKAGKHNALVSAFVSAIRGEGLDPAFKVKTGTSDMNLVGPLWSCPIVAYGPGESALDHTPNEHVTLEEYGRAISVMSRVIERLANQSR